MQKPLDVCAELMDELQDQRVGLWPDVLANPLSSWNQLHVNAVEALGHDVNARYERALLSW